MGKHSRRQYSDERQKTSRKRLLSGLLVGFVVISLISAGYLLVAITGGLSGNSERSVTATSPASNSKVTLSPTPLLSTQPTTQVQDPGSSNPFHSGIQGNPYWKNRVLESVVTNRAKQRNHGSLIYLAAQPVAHWIGPWYSVSQLKKAIRDTTNVSDSGTPLFVVYGMGGCLGKEAEFLKAEEYRSWIRGVADELEGTGAAVILEPDALALAGDECPDNMKNLVAAVSEFKEIEGLTTYLDAGHSRWLGEDDVVRRVQQVGGDKLHGLSLNVSNVLPTQEVSNYGERLAERLGMNYVVDTSRNGGDATVYCNPNNDALGEPPRAWAQGDPPHRDALLWVKAPGEGDGDCNDTDKSVREAGLFYPDDAVRRVQARWGKYPSTLFSSFEILNAVGRLLK